MVLTVTLNAALDVTYTIGHCSRNEPVRVRSVSTRPGGKGINVAFVLAALDTSVTATGLAGGHRGDLIRRGLAHSGITEALFPLADESRQTITAVADDGSFAEYDEPGAEVAMPEWDDFVGGYRRLLETCSSVVCAGSLPSGLSTDAYATLVALAHDGGRPVLLDTSGEALRSGIEAEPDVLKVNRAELADLAGQSLPDDDAVIASAERIGGTVIVTLGADGVIATGPGGRHRVRPPLRHGNPVGAGDAFSAGLVCDAVADDDPSKRLAFAVAVAASAVGQPGAGQVDLAVAHELVKELRIETL